MNIRSILQILILGAALTTGHFASAQVTSTSGDARVNDRASGLAITEGVLRVNGVLYVVTAGIAKRIDLADGQMATMDGLIRAIPANATLPGGVPQATISSGVSGASAGGTTTRTETNTTATGATNTPQAERNRAVGDPTPGATTPSVR